MRKVKARTPSPAMIVACMALFVSLSGVGYAAVTLSANSVRSGHIKDGQVKRPDIAASVVNGAKIADGSVTGLDVNEGTLGLADVAFTGSWNDITGTPLFATVATSGNYGDLVGKPALAVVATTGDWDDLTDIPADFADGDDTGVSGGYLRLPMGGAAPPAADCDASDEVGRMLATADGLWVCVNSPPVGWKTVGFDP